MAPQLASVRVLLIVAAVPVAVFLCLRAAGVDVGFSLRDAPAATSSDIQVSASFEPFPDPSTSADDLVDRRVAPRAVTVDAGTATKQREQPQPSTPKPGGKSGGSGGGSPGGTDPTPPPPPPPGPLQPVRDTLEPVTDATGTGPVVADVTGTVEETLEDTGGSLPETPSLP